MHWIWEFALFKGFSEVKRIFISRLSTMVLWSLFTKIVFFNGSITARFLVVRFASMNFHMPLFMPRMVLWGFHPRSLQSGLQQKCFVFFKVCGTLCICCLFWLQSFLFKYSRFWALLYLLVFFCLFAGCNLLALLFLFIYWLWFICWPFDCVYWSLIYLMWWLRINLRLSL